MLPSLAIDGAVATLTLRRPEVANRLAPEDLVALREHVDTVNNAPGVLVLVLRAEGRHFCSGYDLAEIAASSQVEGRSFGEMVDALEGCRAVSIAALQGGVYGGATDMALACDFRVGCGATEMFMPPARLGLHFYQSGMERYVTRLGLDMAKRLFLTAEKLDGPAMRACGFLTHWADTPEALAAEVQRLAATLASMAPIPLLGMKQHLNRIARGQADAEAIRREVQRSVASEDLAEGGRAWREKRPPVFHGR